jgi:hypothetical protein
MSPAKRKRITMNTAQLPPVPAGPLLAAPVEPRAGPVVMLCALLAGG